MDGYGVFSAFYDRLITDVDYGKMADKLLRLFERFRGCCPELVLDLACGSGTLTLELIRRGIDVIGVDGSEDMLAEAMEKAEKCRRRPLFLRQDMRQLDLYGTVNGAVCMLDSLNHLPDTAAVFEVFRRLGLFIEPDGLLIFDVNTPYKHREVLGNNAFVFEELDFLCVWRNRYQRKTGTVDMLLDFFVEGNDGRYDRLTDTVRERAYSLATWKMLLNKAGFELLTVYGEDSEEPPGPCCLRWLLVAANRKKKKQETMDKGRHTL